MKKLLPISLIGVMALMLLLPFGSAFAKDTNISTLYFLESQRTSYNPNNINDGDLSTKTGIERNAGYVKYKFTNPVDITGLLINRDNNFANNSILFYDKNGNVLLEKALYEYADNNKIALNLKDVSSFMIINNNTSLTLNINELVLFSDDKVSHQLGLLAGKVLNNGTNINDMGYPRSMVTDNNLYTGLSMVNSGNNHLWYEFATPVTLTGYRLDAYGTDKLGFYVVKEDGSTVTAVSSSNLKFDNTKQSMLIEDVKKVYLRNSGTQTFHIYEFDVYADEIIKHDELQNLVLVPSHNEVALSWIKPTGNANFTGTKIYKNGTFLTSVDKDTSIFIDSDVQPNTTYTYKVTGLYLDGHETTGLTQTAITKEQPLDESQIPPANVTNLLATDITADSAKLTWTNSMDTDLDKVNIYKNDLSLLTSIPITDHYVLTGLNPNTSYRYHVSLVDIDGNESVKQTVSFTTGDEEDLVPPSTPNGLTVEGGSNALFASWARSPESDVVGYNIYLNGIKHNITPVKSLFYAIGNLENEVSYDVQVSAVDRSGNESPLSLSISGSPISSGMPILGMDYSLKDVAVGVEKWFSSYWNILAFAIAIPLSFYIASRIKLMFID